MTTLNGAPVEQAVSPARPELKPRRPRSGGLTFTQPELAWALGISIRQLRKIQHRLPRPLKTISARPLWARSEIVLWVESGGRVRK